MLTIPPDGAATAFGARRRRPRPLRSARNGRMDRRLANRNLRTGLIAGAISIVVFAASFFAAQVY